MASVCMSRICLTKRPGAPLPDDLEVAIAPARINDRNAPTDDFVSAEQSSIHEEIRQIGGGQMHAARSIRQLTPEAQEQRLSRLVRLSRLAERARRGRA